jgi:predicted Zn-dependent peptidase
VQKAPRCKVLRKPIEQTHLVIACRAVSRHDPRRFAGKLASVILGENMSSRLFQTVREQRGLAYSVASYISFFADAGSFSIQAGLENARFLPALKLILKTLNQLAEKAPSERDLERAKEYLCGQMYIGLEGTENQMMWLGEGLLGHDKIPTPQGTAALYEAVTAQQVREAAALWANPSGLNVAVVSPTVELGKLEAVLG